jgi:hypothetical protein
MGWGFECNDGWYDIIDSMCLACTELYSTGISIDPADRDPNDGNAFFQVNPPKFIATQVKEKFGVLRFYYKLEFDEKLNKLGDSGKYPEINEIKDGIATILTVLFIMLKYCLHEHVNILASPANCT